MNHRDGGPTMEQGMKESDGGGGRAIQVVEWHLFFRALWLQRALMLVPPTSGSLNPQKAYKRTCVINTLLSLQPVTLSI